MEEKRKFIVKRVDESPFIKDDKDVLIICDNDTLEPFCSIGYGEEYVKEGDILTNENFEAQFTNKRIKNVVVGDTVNMRFEGNRFDRSYIGTVDSVVFDEDDLYTKSIAKIKDIRLSEQGKLLKRKKPVVTEREFILNDLNIVHWVSATIKRPLCPCCGR